MAPIGCTASGPQWPKIISSTTTENEGKERRRLNTSFDPL